MTGTDPRPQTPVPSGAYPPGESSGVVVLGLPGTLAAHLARALAEHAVWCRTNGVPLPVELGQLLDHVSARTSQERTTVARPSPSSDDGAMLLALDFATAGQRLGVSERTVRRLVADGRLEAVSIAGCRRIRSADLAAFVEQLED